MQKQNVPQPRPRPLVGVLPRSVSALLDSVRYFTAYFVLPD